MNKEGIMNVMSLKHLSNTDDDNLESFSDAHRTLNAFDQLSDGEAYLTPPDSKGSQSESDCNQERELTGDNMRVLNYLRIYDLTLPAIEQELPGISIASITAALGDIIPWSRGEIIHLSSNIQKHVPTTLPLRSAQDIAQKEISLKQCLTWFKEEPGVDQEDVATLLYHVLYDLTKSGIVESVPDMKFDVIERMLKPFLNNWTKQEIGYLKLAKAEELDVDDIEDELPFKRRDSIERMLDDAQAEPSKVNLLHLEYFLDQFPLTLKNMRLIFPGVPTREVVDKVQELGISGLAYSDEEFDIIKESIDKDWSLEYLSTLLPFRSHSSLQAKVSELSNTYRKTRFKGTLDQLLYDAQWYTSDEFGSKRTSRRSRRRNRREVEEEEVSEIVSEGPRKKRRLTFQEFEKKKQLEKEKRKLQEEEAERLAEIKEAQKAERRRILEERRKNNPDAPKKLNHILERQLEMLREADRNFMSVTGDRKLVKENEKRRRQPPAFYVPLLEERKSIKMMLKKKASQADDKKGKARKKTKATKAEEEEDARVSPFDPYDITVDTAIHMKGRRLFENLLYTDESFPKLDFTPENLEVDSLEVIKGDLTKTDILSAVIVRDFAKLYQNLPSAFPSLLITDSEGNERLNPTNRIRVRSLLYPEHCELFLLAQPRNNEMNPLYEIQKLFQIQYCLYFANSDTIKNRVYKKYCLGLEKAVEKNSLSRLLGIIDQWNLLMLLLSPSEKAKDLLHVDVNPEIRAIMGRSWHPESIISKLRPEVFFNEICTKKLTIKEKLGAGDTTDGDIRQGLASIKVDAEVKVDIQEIKVEPAIDGDIKVETAPDTSEETIFGVARQKSYVEDFIRRLKSKTTISRFCMQQILTRVYARVVSTRSSQLRKYKAFSAEVYGELLPSFVSEVLTKVNFSHDQKFYDLGSGVGNATFQAAIEYGAEFSGGCELMEHASNLASLQHLLLEKHMKVFGLKPMSINFALSQSFVRNEDVKRDILDCDVVLVNNYLFDMSLNIEVGRLLYGLKPGSKIISLRNFITPRYKTTGDDTIFDYLDVEKHEMSDFLSVSWTASKVPYYISTVKDTIRSQYT